MSRPLIGITCGPRYADGRLFYGSLPAYTESVAVAGGSPVLITPNLDEDALRSIYERLDGVLIAGGGDVDPAYYGMTADGLVRDVDRSRDFTEISVTRWAADDDKPLLGICRGCQVANVALGGTLYRDIPKEHPGYNGIDHDLWGKFPRDYRAHTVAIAPQTRLASAIGETAPRVNSMHHQALRDVAPKLVAVANAEDGVIEGIEMPDARFFVGVQWHPEEMIENSEPMRRLFETFVSAARR
jgi:putative glutamine amidotransferase